MPTQHRPNRVIPSSVGGEPPPDLDLYANITQPVPDSTQSATIIEASGEFLQDDDTAGGEFVFSCWRAIDTGSDFLATDQQVDGEYTLSMAAIAAMDPGLRLPFTLRWVDTQIPQSGCYMIAVDLAGAGDVTLGSDKSASITTVGP